jgi:hypothetical protein
MLQSIRYVHVLVNPGLVDVVDDEKKENGKAARFQG